jgi:hypothetical protein
MATPGTLRSLVTIPKYFDGTEANYANWKRTVKLYVRANAAQLTTDEMEYMVALSYMQDGKAAQWAGQVTDQIIDRQYGVTVAATATLPGTFWAYMWTEFWTQADTILNLPNTHIDASLKLNKLEQGKLSAEEYSTPQTKQQTYVPSQQPQVQQPQHRQPVRDLYAMEVNVMCTATANLTPSPRPKVSLSLDADR